jgi:hypothetical protein
MPSVNITKRSPCHKSICPCPWGALRIHGELLKLGIAVAQSTVPRYLSRHRKPPSPTWRTFLTNHLAQTAAIDFFTVPTATFRFVFVVLAHESLPAKRKVWSDCGPTAMKEPYCAICKVGSINCAGNGWYRFKISRSSCCITWTES